MKKWMRKWQNRQILHLCRFNTKLFFYFKKTNKCKKIKTNSRIYEEKMYLPFYKLSTVNYFNISTKQI